MCKRTSSRPDVTAAASFAADAFSCADNQTALFLDAVLTASIFVIFPSVSIGLLVLIGRISLISLALISGLLICCKYLKGKIIYFD